jgi:hypothetical protein
MTTPYSSSIDLASIERCWPDSHVVPQLILDFAALIKDWPHGAIGYFTMKGNRFDDYWIELGGELAEKFGTFLSLPDGTRVSLWFHDQAVQGSEPVIELGGEGELKVLAADLKTFLLNWNSDALPHDLKLRDDEATAEALALRTSSVANIIALATAAPDQPAGPLVADLPKFIAEWQAEATKRLAADPTLQAIAKLLDTHIPRAQEPWAEAHMHVRVAGSRVEIQTGAVPPDYKTFIPLPERKALIPLILRAREERAHAHPERGLWHSASLCLYANGVVMLKASWEFEPDFRKGGRMTRAELDADLARYPRSPRWHELWMDELV